MTEPEARQHIARRWPDGDFTVVLDEVVLGDGPYHRLRIWRPAGPEYGPTTQRWGGVDRDPLKIEATVHAFGQACYEGPAQ